MSTIDQQNLHFRMPVFFFAEADDINAGIILLESSETVRFHFYADNFRQYHYIRTAVSYYNNVLKFFVLIAQPYSLDVTKAFLNSFLDFFH